MESRKPVHSLVLDTGPIIKNEPAVSTLISRAQQLFTVPAIISEIKDSQTRARVQTTLVPFLTIRSPSAKGIKAITDFARRTGDLAVLSRPDIEILALTYDLECERSKGDWRLRSLPGQKTPNGSAPQTVDASVEPAMTPAGNVDDLSASLEDVALDTRSGQPLKVEPAETLLSVESPDLAPSGTVDVAAEPSTTSSVTRFMETDSTNAAGDVQSPPIPTQGLDEHEDSVEVVEADDDSSSDSEGWITATNLKKHQARDVAGRTADVREQSILEAAVLTSDFAMQNVALQMNLNLLSSSLQRVKTLKTFVLRCHACFQVCKDTSKQFCPRCGGPTLARVTCSTDTHGVFRIHLKKNYQYNTRGIRYSIPKPTHGSANGRVVGGGKGGWGHDLVLAEDQKEYQRARIVERKQKERSLMDEDYLPSILTGDRSKPGGRAKLGKNPNSRKRH